MGLRHRKENADFPLRFITTTCKDWNYLFKSEKYFELLKQSLIFCMNKYEAELACYVFMPNHIHLILHFLNQPRSSEFMCDFKKFTSPRIRKMLEDDRYDILLNRIKHEKNGQQFKVWNDRFDDFSLFTREITLQKFNYIHNNPVKKEFCKSPAGYRYSSAGFYKNEKDIFMPVKNIFEIIGENGAGDFIERLYKPAI